MVALFRPAARRMSSSTLRARAFVRLPPLMLIAVPAGAMADMFDRRRIALTGLGFATLCAATLATISWLNLTTPWLLLGFSSLIGVGVALYGPAWQASAEHDESCRRRQLTNRLQPPLPVDVGEGGAGHAKSILLTGGVIADDEVLSDFLLHGDGLLRDALGIQKSAKPSADIPAAAPVRTRRHAEPVSDAGNIDAAAAGVVPQIAADELAVGNEPLDRKGLVNAWVQGDRNDAHGACVSWPAFPGRSARSLD